MIVKWRGNPGGDAEADSVCFGTDRTALPINSETDATVTATGHSEALLSGLEPDTSYYYSVGEPVSLMLHTASTPPLPQANAGGRQHTDLDLGDSGARGNWLPGSRVCARWLFVVCAKTTGMSPLTCS